MAEELVESIKESPLIRPPGRRVNFKRVALILAILLILVSIPVAIYLVKQRQETRKMAFLVPYPTPTPTLRLTPTPGVSPTPTPGDCQAQLRTEAEDRELCDHGNEAKVYVWAERSQGVECPDSSVNYTYHKSSCCGDKFKDCDVACSEHQQTLGGTVTISAGQTTSGRQSVSCQIPSDCGDKCASCQVDVVGGWAQMAWKCPGVTPTSTVTPTPTGILPTPTPILECKKLKVYDEHWEEIIDPSAIVIGDKVFFLVEAFCDKPGGVTDARFRINEGDWLGPTGQQWNHFYFEYTFSAGGHYKVEAMVYSPGIGWR